MNNIIKKLWVDALRSKNYVQGRHYLEKNGSYCCLGVLGDIVKDQCGTTIEFSDQYLPSDVMTFCGLDAITEMKLVSLNDRQNSTFEEIASWIEKNIQDDYIVNNEETKEDQTQEKKEEQEIKE